MGGVLGGIFCHHRIVQHETAFSLNWTTVQHIRLHQVFSAQWELDFVKQMPQTHVARFVDDQTHGTPLVVLTQVDHALGKRGIFQTGHGDQKMMREVDGGKIGRHGPILTVQAS